MKFKVIDHPKATVVDDQSTNVKDDIFSYLVVEHKNGTIDVFRSLIGGCYEVHKSFFDFAHFEQRMPETAKAILSEREDQKDRCKI
jgi:hypothetical protein